MERSLQKKSKVEHRPPTTNNKQQTPNERSDQTPNEQLTCFKGSIPACRQGGVQFVQKVFAE
jgi:hypothetical protein